jgi:uncharacterized membrane protein YgcG
MNLPSRRTSRKLLVATLGLATISYVGCTPTTSGNLMLPPPCDGGNADFCENPTTSGTGGAGGQATTGSTGSTGSTGGSGQGGATGTGGGGPTDAGTPDGG